MVMPSQRLFQSKSTLFHMKQLLSETRWQSGRVPGDWYSTLRLKLITSLIVLKLSYYSLVPDTYPSAPRTAPSSLQKKTPHPHSPCLYPRISWNGSSPSLPTSSAARSSRPRDPSSRPSTLILVVSGLRSLPQKTSQRLVALRPL